jgi:hypothetical protein
MYIVVLLCFYSPCVFCFPDIALVTQSFFVCFFSPFVFCYLLQVLSTQDKRSLHDRYGEEGITNDYR